MGVIKQVQPQRFGTNTGAEPNHANLKEETSLWGPFLSPVAPAPEELYPEAKR